MDVNLGDSATVDLLEGVPGLGFVFQDNQVRGSIDAIAAASFRLGAQPPVSAETTPTIFPKDSKLKEYQKDGVSIIKSMLTKYGGAILADDMGLGKSLQTIALANTLIDPIRVLIAAPRFMSEGWIEELEKWGEKDRVIIRSGDTKAHKKAWEDAKQSKWVITSYEMLPKVVASCFQDAPPDLFVMDEAQMVKSVAAKRTKAAKDLATMALYKLALTGTPMEDKPKDFYGILKVLLGDRFGSRTAFYTAYCNGKINEHGGLEGDGASNEKELAQRLSYYMLRREKKDVLKELPSLTRQVVWLPTDAEGERAFKAAILNKRANATYLAVKATAEAKKEAAVQLAHQAKRFLLLTYERAHAEQMASMLDKLGTPCQLIHGGIPIQERFKRIALAKKMGHGIAATIDSMKGGLNLQGVAHIGIMHTLDWMPLKMAQAEARIHRMGQTENVLWYYLACKETMDEIIVRKVVEKLDHWRAILGFDSNRNMRDDLGNASGGAASEKDALRAIYEAM
jgi:SWI/SNF-related matrix-associated actin-dependent regulator 1 of chromatin subfamily A